MNKIGYFFLVFILTVVALGLGGFVFLDSYFERELYYAPDLIGYEYDKVEDLSVVNSVSIERVALVQSPLPAGQIFKQDPLPGSLIRKKRYFKVWVSSGQGNILMPNFSGNSLADTRDRIERLGGVPNNVVYGENPNLRDGMVIATSPASGELISEGEKVDILLNGREKADIIMQNLIGFTFDEAKRTLADNKLEVGEITYVKNNFFKENIVIDTKPTPGDRIKEGTKINLILNKLSE